MGTLYAVVGHFNQISQHISLFAKGFLFVLVLVFNYEPFLKMWKIKEIRGKNPIISQLRHS